MDKIDIDKFKKILNQLEGLHEEIANLSKKSYTDALNDFKLKMVNQILKRANNLLGEDYKPFEDFDEFDIDDVPTNSDVTLVLSQYINCMESLREENISSDISYTSSGSVAKIYWSWEGTGIETYPPKNIKK
jgi:hypothetical protein